MFLFFENDILKGIAKCKTQLEVYETYLAKYPNGKYKSEALTIQADEVVSCC